MPGNTKNLQKPEAVLPKYKALLKGLQAMPFEMLYSSPD